MSLIEYLDRIFYPGVESRWDDRAFRDFVLEHLRREHVLLDLGAGAGIIEAMNFRGRAAHVAGLDPDPRVIDNPHLDEAKNGHGENIPWPDGRFDIVIAANVLEHLEHPQVVFAEIARILKPGGLFLFKTPNRNHYMPLIALITPFAFHRFYNRLRGQAIEDTFPTVYRANTPKQVAGHAHAANLDLIEVRLVEGRPEYLRLTSLTYIAGILYERLVNSTGYFSRFRIVILGSLRKR